MAVPLILSEVPDATPYIQYVAVNGQTVFPYPFPITQDADLVVVVNGVTQATDSGYTLSGQGNDTGGNVTFNLTRTGGDIVTLYRDIPIERVTQFGQNSGFSSIAFNAEFNNLYLIAQQLEASIAQCLQIPNTNNPAPVTTLTVAEYANKYLAFDSFGNPTPAVLTSSGSLTGQIVASLLSAVTSNAPTNDKLISAAEIAASAVITNFSLSRGHALRYGADPTGVADSTTALQTSINQARLGGDDAQWPAGTYLVSSLNLFGSGYNIRTGGGRSTVLKQASGTSATTGQIIKTTGGTVISGINVGDLAFTGNISTDTLEVHHCVYVFDDAGAATITDVHFGDLYGTNIRGDVLYVGGIAARPTTGIRFGKISGTNVYRNLLTVAGGEVAGVAVIHDGPVGYRDIDMEPNAGDIYQPGELVLEYVKGGIIQAASDDSSLMNDTFDIRGTCDLDFNRIAATTPGYTSPPGINAQAISFGQIANFHIGYLKTFNYNSNPITAGTSTEKANLYIDRWLFGNCVQTEVTFNSLIADEGSGGVRQVIIGHMEGVLFSTTKMLFNGNGMTVRVLSLKTSGGLVASSIPNLHIEDFNHDCGGATGNIFAGCNDMLLENGQLLNANSATLFVNCSRATLENVNGGANTTVSIGTVEGSGCAENRFIHCDINGIKYGYDYADGYFLAQAMGDANQTLSSAGSDAKYIRCTGALTAQRNLVVKTVPRMYLIDNSTTGGFGVQVIGASGSGIVVGGGKKAIVAHDGTNVTRITADN